MLIDKGVDFPKKFKKFVKSCKPCYILLCTRRSEYRTWKRIAGFIYGFLLGIAFHYLILVDLDFTEDAAFFVGTFICLLLAFGCAFSAQIRCIILLTFPNFGGKVGRGVLKAIVLAVLISGPIENLTDNGKEVVRVFACTTALTFNLTKTRIKLMFKPFADAIKSMKTDVSEIKDTVRSIKDMSAPVVGEVEDEEEMKKIKEENDYLDEIMGDTKRSKIIEEKLKEAPNHTNKGEVVEAERIQTLYAKKIEMKCEDQFTRAAMKCRTVFAKGYDSCYDTVTWLAAWILCWPMKLDFICNIVESLGGAGKCDPSKYIGSGFGEGYKYLKDSRKTFSDNFKNVRLQFKVMKLPKVKELLDAKEAAKAVLHDVILKKEIIMGILVVMKRLLAFLFLRVLLNCQKYHDKYLRDIEYDNQYISKYFRKIDYRRRIQEKHTLLPLKKIERIKLVDPWARRPLKNEKEEIIRSTITLLIEMITATTFVLLDRLFYEALDLVRRHAKIDYVQTGKHDLKLEIKGR
ncbi:unnamed protein product [Brassicogethes aeneus]|uniref:Dendritic cell-specific transmembrane protein-like domain-containing protein n=1 Tax=Brassicogethes aeneus TaxID=1431903 RepID=A0A9P0FG70_BRAAE|nr:unnamed protein product [Brassicogethes aeneus]